MPLVFKKGQQTICSNYRGIAISDCLSKVFETILTQRFSLWYKPQPEQAGAQAGRNCIEQILALRLLIDYSKTCKTKLWVVFVDFSKAYDRVPRLTLLEELKKAGCGQLFLLTVKAMYRCTKFALKSALINVSMGVKQGAPLSCLLFVFYMDIMITKINTFGNDGFLNGLNAILLMDDTAIVATSMDACVAKVALLLDYCDSYGMQINTDKTRFMVINGSSADREPLPCHDIVIKYSQCYWYLGSPITDDAKMASVMRQHVSAKSKHVLKFISFLQKNSDMPFQFKKKVAEACIVSALLYGTETWLTSSFQPLEVQYNRVIKSLLGVRPTIPNDLCYNECGVPRIKDRILARRLSFISDHIRRADPARPLSVALGLMKHCKSPRYRNFCEYEHYQHTDLRNIIQNQVTTKSRFAGYVQLNPSMKQHTIYHSGIRDTLRIQFTRFMLSSHNLKSETGRWVRPPIPATDRICDCGPFVQDEAHVLTMCPRTLGLRNQFNVCDLDLTSILNIAPPDLGHLISAINQIFC